LIQRGFAQQKPPLNNPPLDTKQVDEIPQEVVEIPQQVAKNPEEILENPHE